MSIALSILIPSIPAHSIMLAKLLESWVVPENVEVLVDNGTECVGIKRNRLLQQAKGEYISFHDADDLSHPHYIQLILSAIFTKPDAVAINGIITTNGRDQRKWYISAKYNDWFEKDKIYYRCTNHLSPVRRDIALQVGFPETDFAEDHAYSMGLRGLINTETEIVEQLYHYRFVRPVQKRKPVIHRKTR